MKDLILNVLVRINDLRQNLSSPFKNQRGAGTVEYALVIAVIVIMIVGVAKYMGPELQQFFVEVVDKVRNFAK